jgi:hypothetical protein
MASPRCEGAGRTLGDQTPRGPPLDPDPVSGEAGPTPSMLRSRHLGEAQRGNITCPRSSWRAPPGRPGRPRRGFGSPDFVGRSWPARCGELPNNAASGSRRCRPGRRRWRPSNVAVTRCTVSAAAGEQLLFALVSAGATPREKQVVCFGQPGLTRRPRGVTVRAGAVKR